MCFDYYGYGATQQFVGESNISSAPTIPLPSEQDAYADIEAAYDYLINEKGYTPDKIILFGRSLGSGPTSHMAHLAASRNQPVRGVIIQSGLLSAYRVAFNFRWFVYRYFIYYIIYLYIV